MSKQKKKNNNDYNKNSRIKNNNSSSKIEIYYIHNNSLSKQLFTNLYAIINYTYYYTIISIKI